MKLLVTGGAGFIGSAFVRMAIAGSRAALVVNLDRLTYAGNLENLVPVAGDSRYRFVRGDICDARLVNALVADIRPDAIAFNERDNGVGGDAKNPIRSDLDFFWREF